MQRWAVKGLLMGLPKSSVCMRAKCSCRDECDCGCVFGVLNGTLLAVLGDLRCTTEPELPVLNIHRVSNKMVKKRASY